MSTLRNIKNYVSAVRQNKGILATDQVQIVATSTVPTDANLANGRLYYLTGTGLRMYVEGTWYTIPTSTTGGSAGSWETLYTSDKTLTIDGDTLTFTLTHATGDGLTLAAGAGAAGAVLQFANSGSGDDVRGTSDAWTISKAGLVTCVGLTTTSDFTSTGAAIDWDLIDNNASALSIDASGKAGLIAIVTTNDSEGVTMSGTLAVDGAVTASVGLTCTAGGLTVSDGSTALTDNANDANTLTVTNDTQTTWGNATDAGVVHFTAAKLTTGCLLQLSLDESELNGGSFIRCWQQDGGASKFTVGENGATTIGGSAAGTAALTITAGDFVVDDSDASKFESEDGTGTLLTLDNKAGVIADNTAVLLIDAGGAVASGGNLLRIAATGSPNAGAIGIEFVGAAKAMTAMYIDADPTASDVVTINGGGALTNDNGVLVVSSDGALAAGGNTFRVETAGTPASGAIYAEYDFAGITDTNENVGVLIDAGGKKVQALSVDADPIAGSVALIHTDGATADNKAVLELTSAGTPAAAGSNVLRVAFTGTATNKPTLVEIIGASKDCKALDIDADPTAADVIYAHTDAVIADNKAVLSLHTAGAMAAGSSVLRLAQAGTPAAATSYTLEIDNTGSTTTNNAVCVRIDNHTSTGAVIQATSAGAAAPLLDLYSTNTGATGVVLKTTHTSTGSAADNDVVCSFQMWGLDDGDQAEEFGRIETVILDATGATSASAIKFYIDVAGTAEVAATMKTNTMVVGAGSDHGYVTSNGAYNLVLSTNEGTDSGTITIADAANGDITIAPNGTGQTILTAASFTNTAVASAHTMTIAEIGFVTCTSASGAYSITLPAVATSAGAWYIFKKTDANANAITLDGNAAETIDGAATVADIDAQYDEIGCYCDGTAWHIFTRWIH